MTIPIYKVTIDDEYAGDEDLGIEEIAFTANPAIMVKGVAFSSQQPKSFKFQDDVKMRIAAPALIPDDIYRNENGDEYYVRFTAEEIEAIHKKFMLNLSNNNKFNLEHNQDQKVPAFILETWIVDDPKADKSYSTFGIQVPKGTMFVVAQVTDAEYYKQLVANDQTGFSIEGFLGLKLSQYKKQTETKMNKNQKFNGGPSAYVELPVGVHNIAGMLYTVVEVIENQGTENEYKCNKIMSMVPAAIAEVTMNEDDKPVEAPKTEEVAQAETPKEETPAPVATETPAVEMPKDETMAEEVTETPAETPTVEVTEPVAGDGTMYTKEEVDSKLKELMTIISDLKTKVDAIPMPEAEVVSDVAMNVHQRFNAFVDFRKK